jgi:PD-(D/E)XK nuclease superfamily protein
VKSYQNDRRTATGAASELQVAADLLNKGFEVFNAFDPHASCDLIAMKEGRFLRIQVRTGQLLKNGKVSAGRHGEHDVLAIVVAGSILYEGQIDSTVT